MKNISPVAAMGDEEVTWFLGGISWYIQIGKEAIGLAVVAVDTMTGLG